MVDAVVAVALREIAQCCAVAGYSSLRSVQVRSVRIQTPHAELRTDDFRQLGCQKYMHPECVSTDG